MKARLESELNSRIGSPVRIDILADVLELADERWRGAVEGYLNAQKFLNEVDSAAVYVNASTRFTDGGEFGFGAEIGISTQKLHARGPLGLNNLTSEKYVVYGSGQIR